MSPTVSEGSCQVKSHRIVDMKKILFKKKNERADVRGAAPSYTVKALHLCLLSQG